MSRGDLTPSGVKPVGKCLRHSALCWQRPSCMAITSILPAGTHSGRAAFAGVPSHVLQPSRLYSPTSFPNSCPGMRQHTQPTLEALQDTPSSNAARGFNSATLAFSTWLWWRDELLSRSHSECKIAHHAPEHGNLTSRTQADSPQEVNEGRVRMTWTVCGGDELREIPILGRSDKASPKGNEGHRFGWDGRDGHNYSVSACCACTRMCPDFEKKCWKLEKTVRFAKIYLRIYRQSVGIIDSQIRRRVSSRGANECRLPRAHSAVHQHNRACAVVTHVHSPRVSQLLLPRCSFPDMRPATNSCSWYQSSISAGIPIHFRAHQNSRNSQNSGKDETFLVFGL